MTVSSAEVVARLVELGQTVGCAESLTGGLVVARLVDTPGASAVVRGGVVAYATPLKASLLGVDAELLASRGAVDPDVAGQMAVGAQRVLEADWGVATTGVAGPEPQDGMPVGCVFVAVAEPGGSVVVERHDLPGGRPRDPGGGRRRRPRPPGRPPPRLTRLTVPPSEPRRTAERPTSVVKRPK